MNGGQEYLFVGFRFETQLAVNYVLLQMARLAMHRLKIRQVLEASAHPPLPSFPGAYLL